MLEDSVIKGLLLRTAARDEGSAQAFERLYRLCAPLLLGVARRIVGRQELAEEVLQDCFTKIWIAASRFDPLANQPVAWMVAIARNRAIDARASHDVARVQSYPGVDFVDSEGALEQLFDWGETGEDAVERRQASAWVRECLHRLPGVERQSLVLAYVQGLSHGELAEHLNKPLGTVKSWIRRGMANLRACVETCMGTGR
ncbi:MAG TPA: sigma-70 family RNA polymerase sigma factor [Burkholderiaceae bacterium]|nr:sigma-70 family RNA polymerase sigma factor [Burkholderiaceae bacterium]